MKTLPHRNVTLPTNLLDYNVRLAIHGNTVYKDVAGKTQNAESKELNDYDTFNEHLDEYLEDPEDEVAYPPEIYDALIDETE